MSDLNRDYYDSLNLTVALHPSETLERMMVRLMAYCLNAHEDLSFGRGISAADEPDVWRRTMDDQVALWIEVGEPATDRVKKASHIADAVHVYCFNTKADVWWSQSRDKLARDNVSVTQFAWKQIQELAKLVQRGMDMSVTISGDTAYVAAADGNCELAWTRLQDNTAA